MVYWIPVDNWADADGEGVADNGQVNEVVVDVEVVYVMLKLLRERSVMKMASQEQQMKACC